MICYIVCHHDWDKLIIFLAKLDNSVAQSLALGSDIVIIHQPIPKASIHNLQHYMCRRNCIYFEL